MAQFDPDTYRLFRDLRLSIDKIAGRLETCIADVKLFSEQTEAAVNKPAWLTAGLPPPAVPVLPTAPHAADAAPPAPVTQAPVITIDYGGQIYVLLNNLVAQGAADMSALTDLQGAVSNLTNAETAEAAQIQAAITALGNAAASGGVSQADVEAAVNSINTVVGQIMSQDTALNQAVNPPAPTTPPSS